MNDSVHTALEIFTSKALNQFRLLSTRLEAGDIITNVNGSDVAGLETGKDTPVPSSRNNQDVKHLMIYALKMIFEILTLDPSFIIFIFVLRD